MCKDEVLLDVDDVALGHETKLRWNPTDAWIWSPDVVHEPLITPEQYEQSQAALALAGKRAGTRKPHRSRHTYVLHGLVHCAACRRRVQGHWANAEAYYRCRYPAEYALASTIAHPRNVYLREAAALPALDDWLSQTLSPPQLATTVEAMADAQDPHDAREAAQEAARRAIADCDRRLDRYRAALEAGTDPALVARWTAEVNAERIAAQSQLRQTTGRTRMTTEEIQTLVTSLGHLADVLHHADPADKTAVYQQLGLTMTYEHEAHQLQVESRPVSDMWVSSCPRTDTRVEYMAIAAH
jgi:site-specific DNA recombinase